MKNKLRAAYDKNARLRDAQPVQSWKVEQRERFLSRLLQEGKETLLEIGAGTGRDSAHFQSLGLQVVCTDLSSENIKLCRGKGLDARVMDFSDLQFPDGAFDAVYALNCLLHVPKDELPAVLAGIEAVMKPGGLFFMGVYGGIEHQGVYADDFYRPKRFFSFFEDQQIKDLLGEIFDLVSFERVETGQPNSDLHFQSIILRKRKQPNPWDDIFQTDGRFFTEPHEDLPGLVEMLKERGAEQILDLGSGSGRHVVYLASQGFQVYGLDNSPEGLALTKDWLASEKLSANLQLGSMHDPFPYDEAFFDGLISVQVVHHAKLAAIRQTIAEMARVLKSGGLCFVTVPKTNYHPAYTEIEPATILPLEGPEKGLPHHYFTPQELHAVFKDFEIIDIHIDSVDHYCMLARRG